VRQSQGFGVDIQLNLESETVEQSYLYEPLCLAPESTVREAMERMSDGNRAAVLVCREGRLVGIFTERDALKMMARGASFDVPLGEVMTRNPVVLSRRDSVGSAIAKMSQGGYRRLPIVDEQGRPLGLLKIEGILHYLVEHFPAVVHNLPPEPHHTTHDREGA
jgi:CBS domain-containing protein